jgi:hypothetical protein
MKDDLQELIKEARRELRWASGVSLTAEEQEEVVGCLRSKRWKCFYSSL